ncbi:SET domain-containing protein 5, partial [Neurospora sp. IMI 360204]
SHCLQSGTYCIYTNPTLSHNRGIVLITKPADFQKISRLDHHLSATTDRIEAFTSTSDGSAPAPFEESYILSKGRGLTATVPLRRGKPLMAAAPVLLVHKDFFGDIWRRSERNKLLEKAVSFLPEKTRERFDGQRRTLGPEGTPKKRSIEQILLASPFEIDLGSNSYTPVGQESMQADHSKHYVNYPAMALFTHSCRPNVAFHIDGNLALRTTVARKVAPGEELSVAYIDPMRPRKERMEWVGKYRPSSESAEGEGSGEGGGGCPCPACSGHYPSILSKQHGHPHTSSPAKELAKSDARLAELESIRSELRNHESRKVTPEMIEKFIKLHVEEGLGSKMAEAYELAATNYNYLGEDRKAKKYADLAVQAARIEYGRDANDVIAMRIMAGDVRGHWSYQYKVKRMGGA